MLLAVGGVGVEGVGGGGNDQYQVLLASLSVAQDYLDMIR